MVIVAIALVVQACEPAPRNDVEVSASCETTPDVPVVGPVGLECILDRADGTPVEAQNVRIEAAMTHPGMQSVFAAMEEVDRGSYTARLDLTMAGDWYLVLSGEVAGGGRFEEIVFVPGVRSK